MVRPKKDNSPLDRSVCQRCSASAAACQVRAQHPTLNITVQRFADVACPSHGLIFKQWGLVDPEHLPVWSKISQNTTQDGLQVQEEERQGMRHSRVERACTCQRSKEPCSLGCVYSAGFSFSGPNDLLCQPVFFHCLTNSWDSCTAPHLPPRPHLYSTPNNSLNAGTCAQRTGRYHSAPRRPSFEFECPSSPLSLLRLPSPAHTI